MLRIVKLVPTGTAVKAGDVVIEFDPADQQFALEQAKSELAEAEQQIVKMKADTAVQAAAGRGGAADRALRRPPRRARHRRQRVHRRASTRRRTC